MNRRLRASLLGIGAGAVVFALLVVVGLLLFERLSGNSTLILALMLGLFVAVGLYGGWLVGLVVFSAALGPKNGEETTDRL